MYKAKLTKSMSAITCHTLCSGNVPYKKEVFCCPLFVTIASVTLYSLYPYCTVLLYAMLPTKFRLTLYVPILEY